MNKKGFTLVELLATLIILGLIVGITVVSMSGVLGSAKNKTEEAFIDTLEDAISVYLDSDAKMIKNWTTCNATLNKNHKTGVLVKKATDSITFKTIINPNTSMYTPITEKDLINPANKEQCNDAAQISIYKDDDGVYYYEFDTRDWQCLNSNDAKKIVTSLPEGFVCGK